LLTLKIYFCPTFGLYGARSWGRRVHSLVINET